jgi:hypothetical protein
MASKKKKMERWRNPKLTLGKAIKAADYVMSTNVNYAPWKVTLTVQGSKDATDLHEQDYYVRARTGELAVYFASQMFERVERLDLGIKPGFQYPELMGKQEANPIDDEHYITTFKQTRNVRKPEECISAGPRENPSAFVYFREGRRKKYAKIAQMAHDLQNAGIVLPYR